MIREFLIEDLVNDCWCYFYSTDDKQYAIELLSILHKKHPRKRFRLIEVIDYA